MRTRCIDCDYLMTCDKTTTNPYNYCEYWKKKSAMWIMADEIIEEIREEK